MVIEMTHKHNFTFGRSVAASKNCDRTPMPVLRHFTLKLSNAKYTLDVLEAPCEHAEIANAGILKKGTSQSFFASARSVQHVRTACQSQMLPPCESNRTLHKLL